MEENPMNARHVLRAVTTAGLVTALAVPTAAFAEAFQHTDPAKDVQKVDNASNEVTNVPDDKTADVVHLKVVHTVEHVRTTVRLRDLGRSWIFVSELQTADKKYDVFGVRTGRHTQWTLAKGNGRPITCDDLVGAQDRSANTVTVTVPDSCLGDPHWVKAGVGFAVMGKNDDTFADDAQRTRHASERHLTMSRKIRRG
jgi:hypothetical protein